MINCHQLLYITYFVACHFRSMQPWRVVIYNYCRSRSCTSGALRARYATAVFILLLNKYRNLAISIKYTCLWCVYMEGCMCMASCTHLASSGVAALYHQLLVGEWRHNDAVIWLKRWWQVDSALHYVGLQVSCRHGLHLEMSRHSLLFITIPYTRQSGCIIWVQWLLVHYAWYMLYKKHSLILHWPDIILAIPIALWL